jgi:hypothetical protein
MTGALRTGACKVWAVAHCIVNNNGSWSMDVNAFDANRAVVMHLRRVTYTLLPVSAPKAGLFERRWRSITPLAIDTARLEAFVCEYIGTRLGRFSRWSSRLLCSRGSRLYPIGCCHDNWLVRTYGCCCCASLLLRYCWHGRDGRFIMLRHRCETAKAFWIA